MAYNQSDYDIFIGIDVDRKSFAFTVKDQNQMNRSHKIPAQAENLYRHIRNTYDNKRVICAYEVGGTGYHLRDYLTTRDIPCLMVSPPSMPKASTDRVKNNRLDSEKLAQHLKSGVLPSIRVPEETYRELRHLTHTREDYVTQGRIAKQRVKALLLFTNLYQTIRDPLQNWSSRYIKELAQLECSTATRQRLDLLLEDLIYARKQNLRNLKNLRTYCQNQPAIKSNLGYLQSIPGIGFITAVTLLANIGDPGNLNNARELGGFIGLVPREHSTGEHVTKGSITHLGNRTLRSLLVEAAWVAIRRDRLLNQFYQRVRAKHHPSFGARKAIVAVARKLTMIIYSVLKEQRDYIPR
jgi:transposase